MPAVERPVGDYDSGTEIDTQPPVQKALGFAEIEIWQFGGPNITFFPKPH